ncbi:hypothetical protein C8F04DRAFT_962434 [Mycena alexandri]|uniref:Uncharacterized protein n=1 Tax=Mycena alexandri TaxID=1745969 RepID=A0AAD6SME8_9AGAR|nr:hypothetical protein C8F04DRAFT_962434 [Mycena alexandri]
MYSLTISAVLGAFDGRVGAVIQIGAEAFFVTTNTDYVPAMPSVKTPHEVFLRLDRRYGTDDPTLWPQPFSEKFCHLAAIPQREARLDLRIMWWNPERTDFISGSSLTSRLGRLSHHKLIQLQELTSKITTRARSHREKLGAAWAFVSNVGKSMQQAMLRLQSLPSNFEHMVLGVLTVQRFYLELEGLLDYMLVYKPRMEDFDPAAPANDVAKCLGAFISQPEVAQRFHSAGLPFWLYRPLAFFGPENILAVVTPLEPPPIIDQPALPEQPVVYSGNSTEGKILAMAAVAVRASWYHDPFKDGEFAPGPSKPLAGPKSVQKFHPCTSLPLPASMYPPTNQYQIDSRPPTTSQKASSSKQSQPARPSRNKFEKFDAAEMPTYIPLWSKALRAVETAGIKSRSTSAADKHYVLPEPALLASPERPERRQLFIHHWVLLKDVFHYRIGAQETPLCLSSQEWRDVLEARLDPAARRNVRTANARTIDSIIGPALQQFSIDPSAGFPPPRDTYPTYTVEQARAIIWDISETNFRFELMALDKRASLYTREEEVTRCFPGGMLLGIPLEYAQQGVASPDVDQRHRYIHRIALLMLDWRTDCRRPTGINRDFLQKVHWSTDEMGDLEWAVARYYTESFFEYFGRAAVLPMGL